MLQQFRASPRMQDMDFPAEFMLPLVEEVYMEEQVENMVLEAKTTIKKYFWVKFILWTGWLCRVSSPSRAACQGGHACNYLRWKLIFSLRKCTKFEGFFYIHFQWNVVIGYLIYNKTCFLTKYLLLVSSYLLILALSQGCNYQESTRCRYFWITKSMILTFKTVASLFMFEKAGITLRV